MSRKRMSALAAVASAASVLTGSVVTAEATYRGGVGRVAFPMAGAGGNVDVYTALPDGRGLKRLTEARSFDACPTFAPDGRTIAFCSDRTGKYQIWLMSADGTNQRQLTMSPYPALLPDFSPDGRRVAFHADDGGPAADDIYVVDLTGRKPRRFTGAPGSDAYPVFSPDGKSIAFVSSRKGTPQIWLMDAADGRHQRALTRDATSKGELPDWSPDARRLAYIADGDVWVMQADGTRQRNLTRTPAREYGAAWSPDGTMIAFVRYGGDRKHPNARRLYVMNADGSAVRQLLRAGGKQLVPAWQPLL